MILRAAVAAGRVEACGLLLGRGAHVATATRAANVADDPAHHFEIDPAHLFAALRAARAGGPELLGHWHSHPSGDPSPSATDAAMAAPDGQIWAIVGDGRIGWWRAVPDGAVHGRFVAIDASSTAD